MRKNLLAVLLSAVMVAAMLTGCGDATEAPAETATEATEEVKEEVTEEVATEEAAGCSDEVFAALQEDYAMLVECRDQAAEIYNDEAIAENPDITALFNETDEIVAEMGEITQDQITDEDAIELENAMCDLIDTYATLVDGMEIAE